MRTRRTVEFSVTGAYPISIISHSLRRVVENLMSGLDSLELGVIFHLFPRVSVRMVFES